MHYLGQLPDLPLPHTGGPSLRTRRKPLAQVILCQGCCCAHGQLVPVPGQLVHLRFERWPRQEEAEPFTPIAQDPADIVLLTAADTEVLTWSAAVTHLPEGFPSVRALNIERLRQRRVCD